MIHSSIPKTIANHPAVECAVPGEFENSDYKYWVELKDGWCWQFGRNAGGTGSGIHSVQDFKYSNPVTRQHYTGLDKFQPEGAGA